MTKDIIKIKVNNKSRIEQQNDHIIYIIDENGNKWYVSNCIWGGILSQSQLWNSINVNTEITALTYGYHIDIFNITPIIYNIQ